MTFLKVSALAIIVLISQDLYAQSLQFSNDNIQLSFSIEENGTPVYSLLRQNKKVINRSSMGFTIAGTGELKKDFELTGTDSSSKEETWQPVWGEVKNIRNKYKQLTVHLRHRTTGVLMDIVFKLFEEGMGFRYEFPQQEKLKYFIVTDEHTAFAMDSDHKTFWIPGDYDSNEYPYSTTKISEIHNTAMVTESTEIAVRNAPDPEAVQTPLMMKTDDGLYINIHEAALRDYPAMQLHTDRKSKTFLSSLVPDAVGNKAYLHAPCKTPWRTIIVSDKAADILQSKMILNLNEPSVIKNTSWIRPMKFVGVWWEMQTGVGGWNYANTAESRDANGKLIPGGRHSANTANVKRYIDFASKHRIGGVLVEGWNVGWEDWFGKWKEEVFDFVTPYPDFDVKELRDYAAKKNVQLIMHNETSGSATNYERRMDTAFRFMNKFGYHSVKTGYVGRIIPRGEHHDGQWMVNHYERSVAKAAKHQVMIDIHESVRPTGMQRTYPNWLANEAARGNEFNAFSIGNPPEHETILPFTRLMGGPMDYTPGIFKLQKYAGDTTRSVHTTLAKQLALYVTLYSPLQMAADLPRNYEAKPDAFRFIEEVPVEWDDTKILYAEPGDYLMVARKQKGSPNWFIGAITDENKREMNVNLDFLEIGQQYTATIYADAGDAHWKTNPEAYVVSKQKVDNTTALKFKLAEGGGCAVSIIKTSK